MSYFANECFICRTADTLKICSCCNMIAYCGLRHQKFDWPNHKEFCNVISSLMEEFEVSHIYENQHNSDSDTWCKERERVYSLVQSKLNRPLHLHEEQMLLMPRSCFVCHSTLQESLSTCSRCMCVNFCENHLSSPQHDKDCASLKLFHDLDGKIQDPSKLKVVLSMIQEIVVNTKLDDLSSISKSMEEYLNKFITTGDRFLIQACASNMLTMSLTLFNAINKLNLQFASNLVVHVRCEMPDNSVWELLLHLFPNLTFLKLIFVDQPESAKLKIKLCEDCNAKDKKLILQMKDNSYKNFVKDELYQKPDVLAYYNAEVPKEDDSEWQNLLEIISRVGCPMLLTCATQTKAKAVAESLKTSFWTDSFCYEGLNDFRALEPLREWTDGGIGKINQFVIITEGRSDNCRAKQISNESPLLLKKEAGEFWDTQHYFYSHICRVCRVKSTAVTCKFCNMVFYCSELHRREDWYYHKDLCKIIQKLLIESGRKNIFAGELDLMQCQKVNSENWLNARLSVLSKVQALFERELLVFEQQMFLFPKTCFGCHECDLSKLSSCRCGIILCKLHKDFRGHKAICNDVYLSFLLVENEEIVNSFPELGFVNGLKNSLPDSMQDFLDSRIVFEKEIEASNVQKILIAELLTKPLTLLCAIKKLKLCKSNNIVVHVLGSKNADKAIEEFWEVLFFWLQNLNKLSITFVGWETKSLNLDYKFMFDDKSKSLIAKSYPLKYEQFVLGKFFTKPDIIIGFDLDLHECDLEVCDCNDDILAVRKMRVPFIMTSGSKERSRKDHRKISDILQDPIAPDFAYLNPFASLEPVRDFETEGLRYSNKCVVIYSKWTLAQNEKVDIFAEQVESGRSLELEKKLSELLMPKSKVPVIEDSVVETVEEPKKLEKPKNNFEFKEKPSTSVFAASSELKNMMQNFGNSKTSSDSSRNRKIFEEPDLGFVKSGKYFGTEGASGTSENVEEKCRQVFDNLLDEIETGDVEIEETEDDYKFGEKSEKRRGITSFDEMPDLKMEELQTAKMEIFRRLKEEGSSQKENKFPIPKAETVGSKTDYKPKFEMKNPFENLHFSVIDRLSESLKKLPVTKEEQFEDCEETESKNILVGSKESKKENGSVYETSTSKCNIILDSEKTTNFKNDFSPDCKIVGSKIEEGLKTHDVPKEEKLTSPKMFETSRSKCNLSGSSNTFMANSELKSMLKSLKSDCKIEEANMSKEKPKIETCQIFEKAAQFNLTTEREEKSLTMDSIDEEEIGQFKTESNRIQTSEKVQFSYPEHKKLESINENLESIFETLECGTANIFNANSELVIRNLESDFDPDCDKEDSETKENGILKTNEELNFVTEETISKIDTVNQSEDLEIEIREEIKENHVLETPGQQNLKTEEKISEISHGIDSGIEEKIFEISKSEDASKNLETEDCKISYNLFESEISIKEINTENVNDTDFDLNTKNGRVKLQEDNDNLEHTKLEFTTENILCQEMLRPDEKNDNLENKLQGEEEDLIDEKVEIRDDKSVLEFKEEQSKDSEMFLIEDRDNEKIKPNPNTQNAEMETLIEDENLKPKEIDVTEIVSVDEATKSESESVGVNVENRKIESTTVLMTQSSPTEDLAENFDLFKEILLLKEEVKRLRQNEEAIKSENSRLKEEVDRFQKERN